MKAKTRTDAEIMSILLEELNYSANKFASVLGYSSSASIYHILSGENNISSSMADKIVSKFPGVNYMFVTRGETPVLLVGSPTVGTSSIKGFNRPSLEDIPQTLINIEELLVKILEQQKMNAYVLEQQKYKK